MKHSVERILTTHAGSLPRPPELLELVKRGDSAAFEQHGRAELLAHLCTRARCHG